ncbi:MAG: sulfite exporter TauE/SafE family protein [Rhodospirillaceae bacterium]
MLAENFLGVPDTNIVLFFAMGLTAAVTTFLGTVTGTAGGLLLLVIMTFFYPLVVLIPVHTVVQLGAGTSRAFLMWRYVKKTLIVPFSIGSALGALAGGQIFVTLPSSVLQGILGAFILVIMWMPRFAAGGPERTRFGILGFVATFLGVFVSATGTFLSPFIAHASSDRRIHVSTMAMLMALSHIAKLVMFGFIGFHVGAYLPLIGVMVAGAFLGNWAGGHALDRIPEKTFRIVFRILLTLLALRLLIGSLIASGWLDNLGLF